jgi:hypothetical protein
MTTNYHERNHWIGTAAEMALCAPVNPGAVWFQTDTLDSYWWDGAVWNAMGGGGGALADHEHAGVPGDGGQFDADHLLSTGANDGDVLTSDGAGNSAWEPGGGGALVDHVHSAAAGEGGLLDWDTIWSDAVHSHSAAGEGGTLDWDNIWSDAVHDHSAASEGGTLDWDSIWSDAVHDHSAAAEGGTFDAANLTSGASGDGDVLTSDGAGGAAWEAPSGGSVVRHTILTFSGILTVSDNPLRIYNNFGATQVITKVFICVNTAPVGGSIIVDVHNNGVTIFTNQAHRPEIAAGAYTANTILIDVDDWDDGDYLTAHIDQIGGGVVGSDLVVQVVHS